MERLLHHVTPYCLVILNTVVYLARFWKKRERQFSSGIGKTLTMPFISIIYWLYLSVPISI